MNELALFAGAGGGLLASRLLGWRTVCAVEREPFARDVLMARQNDGALDPFPIWDDVRTFDARPWRGAVGVVSGGFPCTDISVARAMWGRAGINGEASGLWREYLRIVEECEPAYVWAENSPALRSQGLDVIVQQLAGIGYVCRWITLGADDVGLRHKRKRLWCLATHADRARLERHRRDGPRAPRRKNPHRPPADVPVFPCPFCGHPMENDDRYGCANCHGEGLAGADRGTRLLPGITGMAHGVADRVDRLVAVGNGQVPRVAATAFRLLAELE
jgi:DNA (cytosine-5)-methyltransferase 1